MNPVIITPTFWGALQRALKAVIAFVTVASTLIGTALSVSPTHSLTAWEVGAALVTGFAGHQFVYHATNADPTPGQDSVTAGTPPDPALDADPTDLPLGA